MEISMKYSYNEEIITFNCAKTVSVVSAANCWAILSWVALLGEGESSIGPIIDFLD
jgi:hypothetical protein